MHGSPRWQTQEFWREVDHINDGDQRGHVTSRHAETQAAREKLQGTEGGMSSANLKNYRGLHSYNDKLCYTSTWKQLGEYVRDLSRDANGKSHGVDYLRITPQQAAAFLRQKAADGCSYRYVGTIATHLTKFGSIQERLGVKNGVEVAGVKSWDRAVGNARDEARSEYHATGNSTARAFNPEPVLRYMEQRYGPQEAAIGRLYIESGARKNEICDLRPDRNWINADNQIRLTNTKNGKIRFSAPISAESRAMIEKSFAQNGRFSFNPTTHARHLNVSLNATGELHYRGGAHAYRHTFVHERINTLVRGGMPYETAQSQVSRELGHNRLEVLAVYERGASEMSK